MTDIEITRWQPVEHSGNVIASFNFRTLGITVRGAMFQRVGDGYHITMPFGRYHDAAGRGITAVGMERELFDQVRAAAVAHYQGDTVDEMAGVRRVVRADVAEVLEQAGI